MKRAVVGIGSDHGEDATGWRVVELLRAADVPDTELVLAREPSEILHRCEGWEVLHIVDACMGSSRGRLHQMRWPTQQIAGLRWTTSHGTDVPGALMLASTLGLLTASVTIWGIECDRFELDASMSTEVKRAIEATAKQIVIALGATACMGFEHREQ